MSKVGVLDKVMTVLDCFPDEGTRLAPRRVAEMTGMSTPTTYRLMRAMSEHRLLVADGRQYALGPRVQHEDEAQPAGAVSA